MFFADLPIVMIKLKKIILSTDVFPLDSLIYVFHRD